MPMSAAPAGIAPAARNSRPGNKYLHEFADHFILIGKPLFLIPHELLRVEIREEHAQKGTRPEFGIKILQHAPVLKPPEIGGQRTDYFSYEFLLYIPHFRRIKMYL